MSVSSDHCSILLCHVSIIRPLLNSIVSCQYHPTTAQFYCVMSVSSDHCSILLCHVSIIRPLLSSIVSCQYHPATAQFYCVMLVSSDHCSILLCHVSIIRPLLNTHLDPHCLYVDRRQSLKSFAHWKSGNIYQKIISLGVI